MNFEKLSGAKKFSEKTTISIHFNLLQVCPSWPIFVFAGLFNSSVSFLMFVENIFCFNQLVAVPTVRILILIKFYNSNSNTSL